MPYTTIIKFSRSINNDDLYAGIKRSLQNNGASVDGQGRVYIFKGLKCGMGFASVRGRVIIDDGNQGVRMTIIGDSTELTGLAWLITIGGLLLYLIGALIGIVLYVIDKGGMPKMIDMIANNIAKIV